MSEEAVLDVMALLNGAPQTMACITAMEMGIFEDLTKPHELSALAQKRNWNEECLKRLINLLVHKSLVTCKEGVYVNTESGNLLVKDNSQSIWEYAQMTKRQIAGFEKLPKRLDTDAKVDDIPHHVTVHKLPVDGTSAIASHGHPGKDILPRYKAMHYQTRFDVDRLVTAFDLSSYKSAVDLGGGTGLFSYALKRRYPEMKVTLFEVPKVIDLVKDKFAENEDIVFTTGDFMEDDLPKADVYLLAKIVHDWGEDQLKIIFAKIRNALSTGGAILLYEKCLYDDHSGPAYALTWDLSVMLHCKGRLRSKKDYRDLLQANGFDDVSFVVDKSEFKHDVIMAKKV